MASTTFSGPVTSTNGFVGNVTGAVTATAPVNVTSSTLAVTRATHGGRATTLNRAAGIAVTLPAASGSGTIYEFVIGTSITSNTTTIKVANASDTMTGSAYVISDNSAAVLGYKTGASDDTVTFNGNTLGGLKGDTVRLVDVAANLYAVQVFSQATGTEATPFSATV